ncbi:MAG: PD40 domain-containing protein [Proteobacteria bacterium]|nr:PD40 domain-containing protein [Pseudomonadota bacterium]
MGRVIREWRMGLALALVAFAVQGAESPGRTFMRFPTLYGNTIVFSAHDNLWSVPRAGGAATRLSADSGRDIMPRFSPDGRWIAFTGEYQGNRDVYVIPAAGGAARRLTFTSDIVAEAPPRWGPNNMVLTWTPDSANIVFLSRREAWNTWINKPFVVPLAGGLPQPLPVDRGGFMSYSPDGKQMAYTRIFRDFRTWKRYDGGLAPNIDIYDFQTKQLEHVTDWVGTETSPMWFGKTIYFLADHDASRRRNLWAYDTGSGAFRQVTHYTDYDIDFPSLGAGADAGIVFQQGGKLHVLDVPSEQLHDIDVTVADDGTRTGARWVDAKPAIREQDTSQHTNFDIAPNGNRAVFSARGDIFTLPAEHGNTRNLTQSSNADDDHPTWSPDGRTIAYTTDISGEQQVAIRPAEGGPEKILTHFERGYFYAPRWSPNGERLAFSDHEHRLWWVAVAGGEPVQVARDTYTEIHDYTWSPDGHWLAYSITASNTQSGIWLYNTDTRKATLVSDPRANDFQPAFDPAGKYLFFISTRHENPTFSRAEFNIATLKTTGIYVTPLKRATPSAFAPQSDEGVGHKDEKKPEAKAPLRTLEIDVEGLMARAVAMPIPAADISAFDLRDDKVFYLTGPSQMLAGPLPGEKTLLHVYDLEERKDDKVVEGLSSYALSADGKKVLYKMDQDYFIADAVADKRKSEDGKKKIDLSHLRVRIEPTQEWVEMFNSAWRLERDLFYSPKMNGVDWQAVRASYGKLLPLVGSRSDLNYLIGEIIGELGNSHTYVGGGEDLPEESRVPTAFLGADFVLDGASGRYRFATVFAGDNTRDKYRSPLTASGVDVRAGEFLLAIDGQELKAPVDPFSLLVGKQDATVRLTVADAANGKRRDVTVQPVNNELSLREQAWIDHNREVVDKASAGKVAYIYLSDMSNLGMEQFIRQFYAQLDKQALIIDDRWNGGGFIDQIVLERLRRILIGMDTNREGAAIPTPNQLIIGPKICLMNHFSASDGDIFPYYFRKYGLGPLMGTRTWGGVRGIRGEWFLLDGGYITIPEDATYSVDSQWAIENHGVDPDIPVDDTPGDWMQGRDVQLQAAIAYILGEMQKHPASLPAPPPALPAYPKEAGSP